MKHNETVRRELLRYRGREVKTTGDGFLATFDGPARAIRCACSIRDAVHQLGISIRAGLHTGECELMGDGDIGGGSVDVAGEVGAKAGRERGLVSSAGRGPVSGPGIEFREFGRDTLQGN